MKSLQHLTVRSTQRASANLDLAFVQNLRKPAFLHLHGVQKIYNLGVVLSRSLPISATDCITDDMFYGLFGEG